MVAPVLPSRWVIAPKDAVDDPDVFPFLAGQGFLEQKNPLWSTKTDMSVSGVQRSRALWSYPLWKFKVSHEVLRDAAANLELQRLVTFFNAHFGSAQAFFYLDRNDNAVTSSMYFATGDGVSTTFQLRRTTTIGGITFTEPVRGLNGAPIVTVAGVATTAFTIGVNGLITFTAAPANGAVLGWTGNFFYLCRFTQDTLDLRQMMTGLWSGGGVEFQSVKL
jgi:uncharacterized protein (TIGR02217 family)